MAHRCSGVTFTVCSLLTGAHSFNTSVFLYISRVFIGPWHAKQFTPVGCVSFSPPYLSPHPSMHPTQYPAFRTNMTTRASGSVPPPDFSFGQHSRAIVSPFSVVMISLLVYAGMKKDQGAPYYMGVMDSGRAAGEDCLECRVSAPSIGRG
jgi:hypothetical protein